MSVYRFRDFQFDTVERRLTRNGEWVELTPKAMDILEVFVGRPGELITRDEMIGKVWAGTLVEEGNLSVHMSKLRKAFGETRSQRYIETVPGSGYRFTASIEQISNGANLSPALESIHISTGTRTSRDSEAVRLRKKGKQFFENINPTTIHKAIECLEQSVALAPSDAEANAYLTHAYRLLHSFGFLPVADALNKLRNPMRQMLGVPEPTCFSYVVAGEIEMFLTGNFEVAERYFQNALTLEPESARALYRLCEVLLFSDRRREAQRIVPTLVELQPYSPYGYTRVAGLFYFLRNYESAIVYTKEVLDLEPRHFPASLALGATLVELNRYIEAKDAILKSYELHPNSESLAMLGYLNARAGNCASAREILHRIRREYPQSPSLNCDFARILLAGHDYSGYEYLKQAADLRESDLIAARVDPRWDGVRSDVRFNKIVESFFQDRSPQQEAASS